MTDFLRKKSATPKKKSPWGGKKATPPTPAADADPSLRTRKAAAETLFGSLFDQEEREKAPSFFSDLLATRGKKKKPAPPGPVTPKKDE